MHIIYLLIAIVALAACRSETETEGEIGENTAAAAYLPADLTCGSGPVRVRRAGGLHSQPASCAWLPRWQLFACTEVAVDGVAMLSFVGRDGRPWYPVGGYGGPGVVTDSSWSAHCGAGLIGRPLGLTVRDTDQGTRIYVVDGGTDDAAPSVRSIDLLGPHDHYYCELAYVVYLPVAGELHDVTRTADGSLFVSDSASVWRVQGADGPAPIASEWLGGLAATALKARRWDADGDGVFEDYLWATLAGGGVARIEIRPDGAPGAVAALGPPGTYGGLAWRSTIVGPRLVVAERATRRLIEIDPRSGNYAQLLDVSSQAPALGGVDCGLSASRLLGATCAVAGVRDSTVLVFEL
jgi:hypothetical protein